MSFSISSSFVTSPIVALGATLPNPLTDTGFARDAYGTDPQWTLDTDLAELSKDVYGGPGTGPIGDGEWTPVDQATLSEAGIYPTDLVDPDTGFQAAVYANEEGQVVVAFAGTDGLNFDDWLANAQEAGGFDSGQYNQAIALGEKVTAAFGKQNVVFTGHSLGGGLATAAALATDSPAVTFNSAGVGPETLDQLGLSRGDASDTASDGLVRRYNVENDFLTNIQEGTGWANALPDYLPGGDSPLADALGYEITLENPDLFEGNPKDAHGIGTVLDAIHSRDIKSQDDDNLFDRFTDHNLIPGGPSVEDLGETLWDVGKGIGSLVS